MRDIVNGYDVRSREFIFVSSLLSGGSSASSEDICLSKFAILWQKLHTAAANWNAGCVQLTRRSVKHAISRD